MTPHIQHVVLDNAPVNGLGWEVRTALLEQVSAALSDPGVAGIVIRGAGKMFCGGADIRQFGTPLVGRPPLSREINALIESAHKPVVAAIHGYALGGGLELAMACHARVAEASARVGLPEVTLGIVPGGGGTQRLPRLIGLERALPLILNGSRITAAEAAEWNLLDMVVPGDTLIATAEQLARQLSAEPLESLHARRARDRGLGPQETSMVVIQRTRERCVQEFSGRKAPMAAISCIEQGVLHSFEEALTHERETFLLLVDGDEAVQARASFTHR